MADQSVKTIKERIKLLRDLKKEGKELSAIQEQELRTLRAQRKEYAGLSKWQKDLLNKGDLRQKNEKIAHKFILKQKEAEKDIAKWLTKKAKVQGEYAKKEATLNKKLEKLVKDGDAYKRVQADIVDLQKQGAKEVGGYDKYIELAEQQKSLNVDLSKIQEDQIANQMKAAQGKLEESDIAAQLVQIAGLEKKLKEDSARLSKEEKDQIKAQISNSKSMLDTAEANNDIAKARLGMESKMDDVSGGLIGKMKGMKAQAAQFNKVAAKNPYIALAMILTGIITLGAKLVKSGMELQKELGLSVRETMKLQATLMEASFEMSGLGISADEVKETAMGLVNEFGSFENVTKDTLVTMSKMNTEFGIAGSTSAALLGVMESVSGSSREALMSQMESTAELARAAGVAPGQVMADVASNTEFFSKYAKDGGANVMEAAIQAKKLGLNMSTVSAMADSLLDFESSIESQMEASMMLGRSINTDTARRLALEGDLVGMQKEVMKQVGNEAEFNAMNTLQRQALAKAFGLSVNDLGKMVRDQEVLNNMTDEERAAREKQAAMLEASKKQMMDVVARVKEIGMMLFTSLLPAFKLIGGAVVLISIALKPFIEGIRVALAILIPIVKVLAVMAIAIGAVMLVQALWNAQLTWATVLSWAGLAPWYVIPLLILAVIGLVSLLLKKFGVFKMLNEYLVKPIKEAWAAFLEFIGGMETVKKVLKVVAIVVAAYFTLMFWPLVLAVGLVVGVIAIFKYLSEQISWFGTAVKIMLMIAFWPLTLIYFTVVGVIKLFKMLAEKVGGFGNLIKIALMIAFAPLFLAWEAMKAVGNFIGGLFGGGKKEPAAASPAVAMADGGVVNSATTAKIGEAGPEAVVPLGDKFDLSKVEEKLAELIAINKLNLPAINKKVGDIGVAG